MTPDLIAIIAVGMILAALILRQGTRFDKRFERVYERFDQLDERFDKLIGRFKCLEGRMTQMVEKQQASLKGLQEAATCNRAA